MCENAAAGSAPVDGCHLKHFELLSLSTQNVSRFFRLLDAGVKLDGSFRPTGRRVRPLRADQTITWKESKCIDHVVRVAGTCPRKSPFPPSIYFTASYKAVLILCVAFISEMTSNIMWHSFFWADMGLMSIADWDSLSWLTWEGFGQNAMQTLPLPELCFFLLFLQHIWNVVYSLEKCPVKQ